MLKRKREKFWSELRLLEAFGYIFIWYQSTVILSPFYLRETLLLYNQKLVCFNLASDQIFKLTTSYFESLYLLQSIQF